MTKKPEELHEKRTIVYNDTRWAILLDLREHAETIIHKLESMGIKSYVYGSLARGDVSPSSDVDIIVPYVVASYKIDLAIGKGTLRELVQATPSSVMKAHIHLDYRTTITFPLFKMMTRELEFYKWGGQVDVSQIMDNVRVMGVDKRLLLIEPTKSGHIEHGVIGYEHIVANQIGLSVDIAKERVRVLTRRDQVGRTGVYLTQQITDDETFEEVAKSLKDSDPALRRTIERREG
ncbi:MAG: nucleotidyltransferase domain-containing protein [Candidatus Thorarchaeota archaeon]